MAKKKKRKDDSSSKVKFSAELTGLIFVLISVIGIGAFGPVGHLIKSFAIFLMGTWWAILIILVLVLGTYMIVKRDVPKFFNAKLIGLYFLLITLLAFSHLDYVKNIEELKLGVLFQNTIDNFLNTVADSRYVQLSQMGGGIIGAFFAGAFVLLFEIKGTYIVLSVFGIFGLIMLLNVSLAVIIAKIKLFFSRLKKGVKESNVFKLPDDDTKEKEDFNKVIITNASDLKQYHNVDSSSKEEAPPVKIENSTGGNYKLPSLDILDNPKKRGKVNSTEVLHANKVALERVLNDFQIVGKVVAIHEGPAVTQYEIEIKAATKLNRITSIHREIALAMAAKDVRIQAPIPGKSTVGIELPNKQIAPVPIRDVLSTIPKNMLDSKILVALGKDLMGRTCCADLNIMPHLLVAGATGSGKSVCINSFIASILMFKRPDEVKLILVDPKKVELSNYNGVPHLLCPVVTNPKKANIALQKIVSEMDRRYSLFEEKGAKNISAYNEMLEKENKKNNLNEALLPYIVVIIDELADLMLVAAKEVEDSIMRITQMARAAGIHLIVATQRPSTDVITGVVKANIPSRIAFTVASQIDSRTILDASGAEKLLGKGDMLYLLMGENHPTRIQGSFISDEEIQRLIDYVSKEQVAKYDTSILESAPDYMAAGSRYEQEEYEDPIYNEVVDFAITSGKISASLIQRRFRLGYNRAARILDLLEERGIVGPPNGSKPREVLVKLEGQDEEEK
ncbi:MAG: DNA translocase FtsK [Bacilli bacterium]|nr:DNA translocase FtsK [Bacilli bacterium]